MKILSPRFLYRRLRSFWQRDASEKSMAEEMQSHIDQLTDRKVRNGMSMAEARRETLREFGGLEQIKERARDEQRREIVWLDNIVRDLRYAARQLRKSPVFTTVAVLSLGIGIGANVAIFSLLDAAVWRPLPVRNPEQLVLLNWTARTWPDPFNQTGGDSSFSFSYPAFERMCRSAGPSAGLFAFVPTGIGSDSLTVVADGQLKLANGIMVSGEYFSSLSANLALGRGIAERDEEKGQPRVAVLSYSFWVNQFNRDPAVLGREVTINNIPFKNGGAWLDQVFMVYYRWDNLIGRISGCLFQRRPVSDLGEKNRAVRTLSLQRTTGFASILARGFPPRLAALE